MSSTAAADDYEHWPDDSKYWAKEAAPAPGYDDNNGLHSHSYLAAKGPTPAKSASPSPAPSEKAKSEASGGEAAPAAPVAPSYFAPHPMYMPHPSSIAHTNPQFYSHPQPMYGAFPPQGYYTYAQPGMPVIVPPSAPAPPAKAKSPKPVAAAPVTSAPAPANYHVYTPSFYGAATVAVEEPKQPQPNVWQGRTKAQVEEDNMKYAKSEGAYGKRKIAPVGLDDAQMCWVIELDGSHTLR